MAYAYIAYLCAYAKYHHLDQFLGSFFRVLGGGTRQIIMNILVAGYEPMAPSWEHSDGTDLIVKGKQIYLPFLTIKGVGNKTASRIPAVEDRLDFFEAIQRKSIYKVLATNLSRIEIDPIRQLEMKEAVQSYWGKGSIDLDYTNETYDILGYNLKCPKRSSRIIRALNEVLSRNFRSVKWATSIGRTPSPHGEYIAVLGHFNKMQGPLIAKTGTEYYKLYFGLIGGENLSVNIFADGNARDMVPIVKRMDASFRGHYFVFVVQVNEAGFANMASNEEYQEFLNRHNKGCPFILIRE